MLLNRKKGEEKLISKVKSKLIQTVLVRNTLKYVQTCEHVTFVYDDDIGDDEFEPFNKKLCRDISNDDIGEILSELNLSPECLEKEILQLNWNDTVSVGTEFDIFDDELLEYLSDDDYLNYL